jgi:DNA (cytosine-5)-methyltransferase 1
MLHIDLFSGIGGFAIAAETVWPGIEHVFCDNNTFCQAVLKKHWPNATIYGDIRQLTADTIGNGSQEPGAELETGGDRQLPETSADTDGVGLLHGESQEQSAESEPEAFRQSAPSIHSPLLLTGGFPCQPFSQAGRRRGTEDDRYLWPEMLRVIREFSPLWVIAENVRGLLTQGGGVVFEQVCLDLEDTGYEVQPLVIPAVAVNAPHRRDRVWFVAYRKGDGRHGGCVNGHNEQRQEVDTNQSNHGDAVLCENWGCDKSDAPDTTGDRREWGGTGTAAEEGLQSRPEPAGELEGRFERSYQDDTNPKRKGRQGSSGENTGRLGQSYRYGGDQGWDWNANWIEVATELCGLDDGLPAELGELKLSKSAHRREQLKAYGNAIVPQVAIEIMKSIKSSP